jgi:hypothetical protein
MKKDESWTETEKIALKEGIKTEFVGYDSTYDETPTEATVILLVKKENN